MGKKGKVKAKHREKHADAAIRRNVAKMGGAGRDGWVAATRGSADTRGSPTSVATRWTPGERAAHGGMTDRPIELAASLVSIGAQLQRQLGHGADDDGLTRARLSALGRLVLGGPCTLGQLAAREGVRPPTMTRLVHSMEAAGLVSRERHPSDGRSILLHATPEGEALLAAGQATRLAPLATVIAELDHEEQRDLEHASAVLGRFLRDVNGARRRA